MSTTVKQSAASLDGKQRDWLKKMGVSWVVQGRAHPSLRFSQIKIL